MAEYLLGAGLAETIARDELRILLQSKLVRVSRRIIGATAPLRWVRADGNSPVGPDVSIPIAERSRLNLPPTPWALNMALRARGDIIVRNPEFAVAVNLSPVAMEDPDILPLVAQAAHTLYLDNRQLVLEITEGSLSRDPVRARATLKRFHAEEIRLSIDDFGTGYS